jgi:hypothetical protein
MKFQWVRGGMTGWVPATGAALAASLATGHQIALITTDPLTYNYELTNGDITVSAASGLTPQDTGLLTVLGPFVDDIIPSMFLKIVGAVFTNTSGGDVTVTGIALRLTAGTVLLGVLVFDDAVTILDGGTLTLDIPIGASNGQPDASLELLDP